MTQHLQHLPHDAHVVVFTGAKGGVGTSTVAALHALALAGAGFPTTLLAVDDVQFADLAGLLGIVTPESPAIDVNDVAALPPSPAAPAYIVVDGGTAACEQITTHEHYLVTRACYLALRRAVASARRPDGIVLLTDPTSSLSPRDIEEVLGTRVVATLALEASTARAIDAGLLTVASPRRCRLAWASASQPSRHRP